MKERRNYYRLLYVQPDAPLTLIQVNHRILMHKLRLDAKPDCANQLASSLNTAYWVLQDPLKRVIYDQLLQKKYSIRTLSLGLFSAGPIKSFSGRPDSATCRNRRNYYRILQVQPDAPVEIIIASYHALMKYPYQDTDLLEEAYAVLANPAVRVRYDAFLAGSGTDSRRMIKTGNAIKEAGRAIEAFLSSPAEFYSATILHHCLFCFTPYNRQLDLYQQKQCLECGSPLGKLENAPHEITSRMLKRISAQGEFNFFLAWPDTPNQGIFQDLSAQGMRFIIDVPVDINDVIKINAANFSAVAEVVHKQDDGAMISVGACFLATKFEQRCGNFLIAHA